MHRFGSFNNKTVYSFLVNPHALNAMLNKDNDKINAVSLKLIRDIPLFSPSDSPITTSEESSPPVTPSSDIEIAETPLKKKVSFEGNVFVLMIPERKEYRQHKEGNLLKDLHYTTEELVAPSNLDERLKMYEEILSIPDLDEEKRQGYQKAKASLKWISKGIEHLLSLPDVTPEMQKDLERAKESLGNLPLISDVREVKIVKARFLQNLDQLKLLKTFIDAVDGINLLLTLESLDSDQREILQKAQDGIRFCALEGRKFCIRLVNMPESRPQKVVAVAKDFIEAVEAQFSEKTPSRN